jgi:hypothetical protein
MSISARHQVAVGIKVAPEEDTQAQSVNSRRRSSINALLDNPGTAIEIQHQSVYNRSWRC